jgi:hypothetical protein
MMQWQINCPSLRVKLLTLTLCICFLFGFDLQVASYEDLEDNLHEDF